MTSASSYIRGEILSQLRRDGYPETGTPPNGDLTEPQMPSPRPAGQAEPCAYRPWGRSIPRHAAWAANPSQCLTHRNIRDFKRSLNANQFKGRALMPQNPLARLQ
jgi:hypothetical protein